MLRGEPTYFAPEMMVSFGAAGASNHTAADCMFHYIAARSGIDTRLRP
jgi:hypothetical protein